MRSKLAGWIDFLRSTEAILVVLILALFAQLPHTAMVFQRVSTTFLSYVMYGVNVGVTVELFHAYIAAIAVEVAVLVFVVRGKSLLSWLFAAASATMNLIYYWLPGWNIHEPTSLMIGAMLWAVLLPAAIAFYSHEIGDGHNEQHEKLSTRIVAFVRELRSPQANTPTVPVTVPQASTTGASGPKGKKVTGSTNGHVATTNGIEAFATTLASSATGAVGTVPVTQNEADPDSGDDVSHNAILVGMENLTQVDRVGLLALDGKSTKEIAKLLGIKEGSVRVYKKQYNDKNASGTNNLSEDEQE